jgi:hypothetical protein
MSGRFDSIGALRLAAFAQDDGKKQGNIKSCGIKIDFREGIL